MPTSVAMLIETFCDQAALIPNVCVHLVITHPGGQMALLWENLAQQLSSVRASMPIASPDRTIGTQGSGDDPSNRRRRLEAALKAIQDSGNTMMIESLKAAIEGREANLNFPPLPTGIGQGSN